MQEIAPFGLFTTDADLKIQSWNEWIENHSGLAAPLVIGRSLLHVFPDLAARKMDEHFRRALNGEVVVLSSAFHEYLIPLPTTVREANYSWMQQTVRIAPLMLEGKTRGTIVIIEDVTQREAQAADLARRYSRDQLLSSCLAHLLRSRDSRKIFRDFFPKVAEFLSVDTFFNHVLSSDGRFLKLHDCAGVSEEQKQLFVSLPLDDSVSGQVAMERRPTQLNHLQTSDHKLARRLKSIGLRAFVALPLLVGDRLIGTLAFGRHDRDTFSSEELEFVSIISQYVSVALDHAINEAALHEAQAKLSQHAQDLEVKIQERTTKLQDTIVQLEAFSYTVAHDLRAPIRALKGYVHVLLDELETDGKGSVHNYLLKLDRAANRLEALTRDLLQFSTVSRQEVRLERTEIGEILQDIRLLRPSLHEEVLEVNHPLEPVIAQPTLLQQCLSNLLDNALKFTAPGKMPHIVIWTEKILGHSSPGREANSQVPPVPYFSTNESSLSSDGNSKPFSPRIRIWVEDNGIGIAPESSKKIFGIFERLNPADKYEGTGIGLAIVARAAQRMGGSCGVEPGAQSGSRFWLDLRPASDQPA